MFSLLQQFASGLRTRQHTAKVVTQGNRWCALCTQHDGSLQLRAWVEWRGGSHWVEQREMGLGVDNLKKKWCLWRRSGRSRDWAVPLAGYAAECTKQALDFVMLWKINNESSKNKEILLRSYKVSVNIGTQYSVNLDCAEVSVRKKKTIDGSSDM